MEKDQIPEAPDDRFYAKDSLRVSLGTRPNGGGSCIVSYTVLKGYGLHALTRNLAKALAVTPTQDDPTFALVGLTGKVVIGRVQPIPKGAVASFDVEPSPK